ncbi:cytochrome-c peroxidase [Microbulbifer hainanensis]|uniref:cytochrome-c peroxidase n=1 Tax=Microbulbifer hainanensis TaxID=2735675 RepID=UPI001867DAB8|nr:cytochrome c peroxidase [Microbulbifer hainanensis]
MKASQCLLFAILITTICNASAEQSQILPTKAPEPEDNPSTPAKVELGKMLFFDPRFSSTGTVSCNSCHNLMEGGDDSRQVSMGVHGRTGGRSAPTVWNAAFHSVQFWDGRAATLEEQAQGPMVNQVEMGMTTLDEAMDRIRSIPGYAPYFEKAFGKDSMNADNAAKAVAAFERTLITPNSPYDRYLKGDKGAMTEQQVRGMKAFTDNGCIACHSGPVFDGPHNPLGTGFYAKFPSYTDSPEVKKYHLMDDLGRYEVTKKEQDKHMFRVPTLRNIALTAPYFHNGSINSLNETVRVMAKVQLNEDLSETDISDIVAFLNALTGEFPEIVLPRLPVKPGTSIIVQLRHKEDSTEEDSDKKQ